MSESTSEHPADLEANSKGEPMFVVIDDDPTGMQAVTDCPLVTELTASSIRWLLQQPRRIGFVLTNTRAMSPKDAELTTSRVVRHLIEESRMSERKVHLVSRGDSTLRGHVALEIATIARTLTDHGVAPHAIVLCPAFPRAGRVTLGGTQYLRTAATTTPLHQTEYASDATFGYSNAHLPEFLRGQYRKIGEPCPDIALLSLQEIRRDPGTALRQILATCRSGTLVVADAQTDDDVARVLQAGNRAQDAGHRIVYRCSPGLVAAIQGLPSPPIDGPTLRKLVASHGSSRSPIGVVIVGSHVGLTGAQLAELLHLPNLRHVEVSVAAITSGKANEEVADAIARCRDRALGSDIVISTSRQPVLGSSTDESLLIATAVSASLMKVARAAVQMERPSWVVSKGGITSHEVLTQVVEFTRAYVTGPMLDGFPSLICRESSPACVVFPGNIGAPDSLAQVVQRLRAASHVIPEPRP